MLRCSGDRNLNTTVEHLCHDHDTRHHDFVVDHNIDQRHNATDHDSNHHHGRRAERADICGIHASGPPR